MHSWRPFMATASAIQVSIVRSNEAFLNTIGTHLAGFLYVSLNADSGQKKVQNLGIFFGSHFLVASPPPKHPYEHLYRS